MTDFFETRVENLEPKEVKKKSSAAANKTNYLNLFLNTNLNHISIRSRLISQLKNKLISNCEQLFNATDLLPITFAIILSPNLRGKKSTNSQNNQGITDEDKNSKVHTYNQNFIR